MRWPAREGPIVTLTSPPGPWERRDTWLLLALAFAYVATRMLWLVLNAESASYWEENYRWVAAHELLEGSSLPLFDYQADHYQGGPLVVILMAVPLFALLGESAIVLKCVALAFALAVLAALFTLMRLYFGRTAAILSGLVLLCGPPLVAYSSLVTMGSHGESTLFSLVQITLLFGMLTGRWRTPWSWGLFGLTSGLGLWFCYTSGLSLAACGLTWLVLAGVPKPRELAAATAGLCLGLVPWLAYNVGRDFAGLTRILELFGYSEAPDSWASQSALEKLRLLVGRDLPTGLLYPHGPKLAPALRVAGEIAFFAPVALFSVFAALRVLAPRALRGTFFEPLVAPDGTRRLELVFFVYGLVHLAVFVLSDFTIEWENEAHAYRILLPPAVLLAVPAIVTAGRAVGAGGRLRAIALVGIGAVLVTSSLATIRLAAYDPARDKALELKGGYIVRGLLLHRKWERDLDTAVEAAWQVEKERPRFETFMGIGWGLEYRYEKTGDVREVLNGLQGYKLKARRGMVYGIRWAMLQRVGQVRQLGLKGHAPAEQARTLERLLRLERVLTRPDTWRLLTGEDEPPPPIR